MAVERKLLRESKKRVMVREFLAKQTERAGFGGAEITRTPMGTRINLVAERPGFVIGRRGATIKQLTDDLHNQFGLDNPQIEVAEDTNPSLNPQIMAQKLAEALERGWHFRRAGHSTLRRIMDSGAKGCLVIIGGKLTGGRKRREKFKEGQIKWCGDTALTQMHVGYATAKKKLGIIGCTVKIMWPTTRLPDEITVAPREGAGTPSGREGMVPPKPVAAPSPVSGTPAPIAPAAPAGTPLSGSVTDVEGVGPKKAQALAAAGFESLADLEEATLDDIAEVEGIGMKLAAKIKQELHKMRGGA